ncbi:hypothetical protein PROFUN_02716 [Planoprotostelium fungivorum]|uniref:Transcription factor Iwr1 domain-containing protein n=1 Tax=Planoprotostelium fungivorum TaxID=1890364 RepID=A0A2P6NVJ0_9EUKA|nr:hypothetical protein PROFUN_02716 [Planoprotostelium fungivorum]
MSQQRPPSNQRKVFVPNVSSARAPGSKPKIAQEVEPLTKEEEEREEPQTKTISIKRKRDDEIRDLFVVDESRDAKKQKKEFMQMMEKFSSLDPNIQTMIAEEKSSKGKTGDITKKHSESIRLFRYSHSIVDTNSIKQIEKRKLHQIASKTERNKLITEKRKELEDYVIDVYQEDKSTSKQSEVFQNKQNYVKLESFDEDLINDEDKEEYDSEDSNADENHLRNDYPEEEDYEEEVESEYDSEEEPEYTIEGAIQYRNVDPYEANRTFDHGVHRRRRQDDSDDDDYLQGSDEEYYGEVLDEEEEDEMETPEQRQKRLLRQLRSQYSLQ